MGINSTFHSLYAVLKIILLVLFVHKRRGQKETLGDRQTCRNTAL